MTRLHSHTWLLALAAGWMSTAQAQGPSTDAPSHAPAAIFVTWNGDPTSTVSVDWHLARGTDVPALELRGPGMPAWTRHDGTSFAFPFSTRTVRRAQITGLQPDATYEMRVGRSRVYRYRTMPARLTRPVTFATGGDTQADEARFGPMNRVAAARDVDFVLFGGDLAYSNGDPRLVAREEAWYETITKTLVTRDGRLIPVIAAIGNHEVFSNRDSAAVRVSQQTGVKVGDSPYYTVLHAHARDRQYRVVDVGDYLSILLLNTGHTAPVAGAQTDWLRATLAERTRVPHMVPVYHVPGYPSVRAFEGATSAQVRASWAPLFEEHFVPVAFENHDHAYKRTHPIRAGRRDTTGVVYIGDGSWGAGPRPLGRDHKEPAWYVAQSSSVNHGILVTIDPLGARYEVVDTAGARVDYHAAPARGVRAPAMGGMQEIAPDFYTARDTALNLDSPAVWHGPQGQAWLLTTAKTGNRVRIDEAATGRFVADLGRSGTGAGEMRRPNGIAIVDSLAFVVERDNARVQVFALPSRRPVGTFGRAELTRPYGIAVAAAGGDRYEVFVTDNFETRDGAVPADSLLAPRLRKYSVSMRDGSLRAASTGIVGATSPDRAVRVAESLAVDPAFDRLLVAEEQEGRSHVKVFTRSGGHERDIPTSFFPTQAEGIAIYPCGARGYVVMTDQSRVANRFHVFDRATLAHRGTFSLVGVTNTDGIALTARPFGPFAAGAMYAVDDDGRVAAVSWLRIAERLGLEQGCRVG